MGTIFGKNVDLETLGNMILSLNASSSRKTSTPLSFSVYTNTPECVSVDFCSNRRSVSCSIPTDRYNKNRQPILHNHDYYELMYIQKGTMQIQIEGTVYSYHQGDVCLFNQKIHHAEIQQENSVIHYCCITDMFLEKYPGDICFYPENNRSFSRFFSEIRTETGSCSNFLEFRLRRTEDSAPDTPNLVHYILTKMKQELQKQDPGAWLVIYGFFCRLLHTLSDPALYDCRFIALNSQSLVDRMIRYIEASPHRLSREDIHARFHYNSDYLNRVFRRHTGMTLLAYCNDVCMKKAASLLLQTDGTVEEIAESIGFSNPSQFYRQFKNHFHMTPHEYRKTCFELLGQDEHPVNLRDDETILP